MSTKSKIEWTGDTWQCVAGCDDESPGCANCYAKRQAYRMGFNPHEKVQQRYRALTILRGNGPQWQGGVRLLRDQLGVPLGLRRGRRIFVNSLSDTFHEGVPDGFIADIWRVMGECPQHTFQVLTKRAERMADWIAKWANWQEPDGSMEARMVRGPAAVRAAHGSKRAQLFADMIEGWGEPPAGAAYPSFDWAQGMRWWPIALRNVHLGVSVENRKHGVPRIEHLRRCPAAVRFLSIEPLLEDLGEIDLTGIHWVILGGESGPGARPLNVAWVRRLSAQCRAAGVALFVKQLGAFIVDRSDAGFEAELVSPPEPTEWPTPVRVEHDLDGTRDGYQGAPVRVHLVDRKGGRMEEWPADLRVREFPRGVAHV